MTQPRPLKDVIFLVADKNMEQTLTALCTRPEALGVRGFSSQIFVHPGHDPGCLLEGVDFLASFQRQFTHALILFDRVGCGREHLHRIELESNLEQSLAQSGWGTRAAAVVIDPELEAWVWSDSPHVERVLGWHGRQPPLRQWLIEQQFLIAGGRKPRLPKEAMENALRTVRLPRSSALYQELAQQVSFSRCTDDSFLKLKTVLKRWFSM